MTLHFISEPLRRSEIKAGQVLGDDEEKSVTTVEMERLRSERRYREKFGLNSPKEKSYF